LFRATALIVKINPASHGLSLFISSIFDFKINSLLFIGWSQFL